MLSTACCCTKWLFFPTLCSKQTAARQHSLEGDCPTGAEGGQLGRLKICLVEQGNLLHIVLKRDFEENPHLFCVSHKSRAEQSNSLHICPLTAFSCGGEITAEGLIAPTRAGGGVLRWVRLACAKKTGCLNSLYSQCREAGSRC